MASIKKLPRILNPDEVAHELVDAARKRDGFESEYSFTSCWFEADGQSLHYVDEGEGQPLLMVHGNPTWSFAWRKLIMALRPEYRVIAIDHLGCGFSAKPQDRMLYTLEGHIRRLSALTELLNLRNISLFSHDWGGAIGMGCAGRMPDRFARFVLMNTGAFLSQAIPLRISLCRIPWLGELANRGLNLFSRAALTMAVERPLSAAARAGLIAPYSSWSRRIAVHEFVQDIPLNTRHQSYHTLSEVDRSLKQFQEHPIQLIWGMKDWCFTPEAFLREFQNRFPHASTLELPDAGHYVFEDATDEVIRQSQSFLHSTSASVSKTNEL